MFNVCGVQQNFKTSANKVTNTRYNCFVFIEFTLIERPSAVTVNMEKKLIELFLSCELTFVNSSKNVNYA